MRSRRVNLWLLVQASVQCVQSRRQIASYIKPPVAHEHGLRELRAVRTEEARLSTVDVAVVPAYSGVFKKILLTNFRRKNLCKDTVHTLTACVHVGKETGIRLIVTVETRVRHCRQHRVISTGSSCLKNNTINMRCNLMCECVLIPTRNRTAQFQVLAHGGAQKAGRYFWILRFGV